MPAEIGEKLTGEEGSERGPNLGGCHEDADSGATAALFEVEADPAHGSRGDDAFADAQQDAKEKEGLEGADPGGGGRGAAPEQEAGGVGPFDAEAIDEPAGGNLQRGVGPEEGAVEKAAVDVGELEEAEEAFFVGEGDREVYAVEVGDHEADTEQGEDGPTAGFGDFAKGGLLGSELRCCHVLKTLSETSDCPMRLVRKLIDDFDL